MAYVSGTAAFQGGDAAYSREEAKDLFLKASEVATRPFIYLSAGVSDAVFRETLELATESGVPFSGVLCGRATWQDGVAIYGKHGAAALLDWMNDRGVENITRLNEVLTGARDWKKFYGGQIQVV
jgi:tagatose 1,6-diphosphate aldolase